MKTLWTATFILTLSETIFGGTTKMLESLTDIISANPVLKYTKMSLYYF